MRTAARSPYMEFSKLRTGARFNLATSGMASYPLQKLGMRIEDLEINGENCYGYEPLKQAIADRYRVSPDQVVTTAGTSFANHLALAALTDPGDEILVEWPTYELILRTAEYLGLRVRRFRRNSEDFGINLTDLEANLSPATKLIVLCNLHNPTGRFTDDPTLIRIGELAKRVGAKVIVDEVYREMLWEPQPNSAVRLDPEVFLSTNSLTKAYGLSGIRCGWIIAPAPLAERMWRVNDLHAATSVFPGELMAVRAFAMLPEIAGEQSRRLETNRALLRRFLDSRPDLEAYWPEYGTVVFARLRSGNVRDFADFFRRHYDGVIVPGEFFEMPDRMRIGVGLETEKIEASLHQMGRALDDFASAQLPAGACSTIGF